MKVDENVITEGIMATFPSEKVVPVDDYPEDMLNFKLPEDYVAYQKKEKQKRKWMSIAALAAFLLLLCAWWL